MSNQQKMLKAKARQLAINIKKIEKRDGTSSKFIEKHQGKLTQQSIRSLQGNGMAAISKKKQS